MKNEYNIVNNISYINKPHMIKIEMLILTLENFIVT